MQREPEPWRTVVVAEPEQEGGGAGERAVGEAGPWVLQRAEGAEQRGLALGDAVAAISEVLVAAGPAEPAMGRRILFANGYGARARWRFVREEGGAGEGGAAEALRAWAGEPEVRLEAGPGGRKGAREGEVEIGTATLAAVQEGVRSNAGRRALERLLVQAQTPGAEAWRDEEEGGWAG